MIDLDRFLVLLRALNREGVEYVMKRDTVRPLDHADAAALRRTFGLEDE